MEHILLGIFSRKNIVYSIFYAHPKVVFAIFANLGVCRSAFMSRHRDPVEKRDTEQLEEDIKKHHDGRGVFVYKFFYMIASCAILCYRNSRTF